MRSKAYARVKYAFPIVFAAIAVALFAAPAEKKKIWPNAVDFSNGKIVGSFVVTTTVDSDPTSISSTGSGGACLFADLNYRNIPVTKDGKCTDDSQCQAGLPHPGLFFGETEWASHCDKDGEHNCWVRPGPDGPDLCNKQPFTPWEVNKKHDSNIEPFDLSTPKYERMATDIGALSVSFFEMYPEPVRWRVVACLNGVFDMSREDPPCKVGSENKKLYWGPPVWVPQILFMPPGRQWPPPPPHITPPPSNQ
jgi:hypothetical protein